MDEVMQRAKTAFKGQPQGEWRTFATYELMWKTLAPNRLALVYALTGAGPLTLRELARRVGRDVRAVHSDTHVLLRAGVLDKTEAGLIEFPFDAIHFDFWLKAA
jgi:predicted transcriptional regulator